MSIAVVTQVSNEGRYLAEWAAHLTLLGVGKIYVFLHNNDGEDPEFIAAKAALDATGIVEWHEAERTEETEDIQMDSFCRGRDLAKASGIRWVMALDPDEYPVLRRHETLPALLDALPGSVGQVFLNWWLHGSNGETEYDAGRLHFEKFPRRAAGNHVAHRCGKGIVRTAMAGKMDLHVHETGGITLGGGLEPLQRQSRHLSAEIRHEIGHIAHYAVRSAEEFEAKRARGYAGEWHGDALNGDYRERRDRNEEAGEDLSRATAALRARLDLWEAGAAETGAAPTNYETGRRLRKADLSSLVPAELPNWRARIALAAAGLLEAVEAAIEGLPEEGKPAVRTAWSGGAPLARQGPTVLALAAALNLSPTQVDDLFINASKINL